MGTRSDGSPKAALVTGISGFTGHYVREELAALGYRVTGVAHHVTGHPDDRVVDLVDPPALEALVAELRPSVVLHLGAITFVPHADAFELYRVNLFGTLNLLDALVKTGVTPERVILASTANVYGNPRVERVTETELPAPVSHYATSKLAMEHMARTYDDRLPLVITRPFNYTGVGQTEKFLVPKMVAHFRDRRPVLELGNLDVERDFSDVRDVARIYARLVTSEKAVGRTVNVASGRSIALRRILALLEELSGHTLEVRVNPEFVRASEIQRLAGDTTRLEEVLGPMARIPFEETLRWMVSDTSRAR